MAASNPAPRISLRGVQKYLNVVEAPQIERRRLLAVTVILAMAVVFLALAIMRMMPLKERVPYVVKVEADAAGNPTGRVTVADSERFTPTEATIRYFLAKWAIDLLTIDEQTKESRLPSTYALLKGQGINDWRRYVYETGKPLARLADDPTLRVRAELISLTFLSDKTALIRVKVIDPTSGNEKRVQITLEYAILPPEKDEDVFRNPIGLWITGFTINNELA